MDNRLFVSSSPHSHSGASTTKIMWTVAATLIPAAGWSVYLFGIPALTVILSTIVFCGIFEALTQLVSRRPVTVSDGSAVLTGLILALTLPPGLPIWICAIGAFVAIVVAKSVFGGLGQNPFNPAMTGRVFLLIAFPGPLTKWMDSSEAGGIDVISGATPLGLLGENGAAAIQAYENNPALFLGQMNGSLGEVSALLLLLGGAFLLFRKIITWHIPVSFMLTIGIFAGLSHVINPAVYAGPMFHMFTGGVIIGAWFMATDYVTSPMFPKGKLIFGIGCGILTMVIRLWAGYPEGVSFAVLIMNACVPIIDSYTRPKKFGLRNLAAAKEGE